MEELSMNEYENNDFVPEQPAPEAPPRNPGRTIPAPTMVPAPAAKNPPMPTSPM